MKNRVIQLLFTGIAIFTILLFVNKYLDSFYPFITILLFLSGIGTGFVIFIENRSPQSTLAWFLILAIFPIVGLLLYGLFGQTRGNRKRSLRHFEAKRELFREQIELSYSDQLPHLSPLASRLATTIRRFGSPPAVDGTSTQLLTNGEQIFDSIFEAVSQAKHHIHVQYYIYRSDKIGTKFRDLLIEKAKSGVEVRFLYDGLGSSSLDYSFLLEMIDAGIQVVEFDPIISPWFIRTVNYRNHRKVVIVDGKVGFTGGCNVGDEYKGRTVKFGFWRDSHIKIVGKAVHQLQAVFIEDWLYATQRLSVSMMGTFLKEKHDFYFPKIEIPDATGAVQIVTSGPESSDTTIRNALLAMMAKATSSIWIATPYFIPDEETLTLLRLSALAGIDVRLLYPGRGDSIISNQASQSYFMPLLESGVSIYIYKEDFMHAKMVLVDGEIAAIGTTNMDIRSFQLNYELMAFLYDSPTAKDIEHDFNQDFRVSTQIELEQFQNRSLGKRILESFTRLISPLL